MKKVSAYVVSAVVTVLIITLCEIASGLIVNMLNGLIDSLDGVLIWLLVFLVRGIRVIFFSLSAFVIGIVCNSLKNKSGAKISSLCILAGVFVLITYAVLAYIAVERGGSAGTPSFYVLAALGLFGYAKIARDEGETQYNDADGKVNEVDMEDTDGESNNKVENKYTNVNVETEPVKTSDAVGNVVMDTYDSTSSQQNVNSKAAADNTSTCNEENARVNNQTDTTRTRYCKFCGGAIDGKTKKCISCGKSANPIRRMFGRKIITKNFILVIALCIAVGGIIVQNSYYQSKLEFKQKVIKNKSEEITSLKAELEENKEKLEETLNSYKEKADFLDEYIVIVGDDGTNIYHSYGCSKLDADSFWAYNINAAESNGYKPCSKCQ